MSVPRPILVRMNEVTYPRLRSTVLDTTDVHGLADFYRRLLGWEPAPGNGPDDAEADEWQIIRGVDGRMLAFQYAQQVPRSTWPSPHVPQQLHLDFTVATTAELEECHDRALTLGASLIRDESDHPDEPICVYADPAGHPFCIFVMEW